MILERIVVSLYQTNCYIVGCPETKIGAVIDPGDNEDSIIQQIKKTGLKIKHIILTHGHVDHIGALLPVKEWTKAEVSIHKKDSKMLQNPAENLSAHVNTPDLKQKADNLLEHGDTLKIGNLNCKIIHTPGHTPGSISLDINGKLFTGDTLFAGSIGRTDFPGGSFEDITKSIKEKLYKYPDETLVYPGHGPETTIGDEKAGNPFVRA